MTDGDLSEWKGAEKVRFEDNIALLNRNRARASVEWNSTSAVADRFVYPPLLGWYTNFGSDVMDRFGEEKFVYRTK